MEATITSLGITMEEAAGILEGIDFDTGQSEEETSATWISIGLPLIVTALQSETGQAIAQGYLDSLSCAAM